MDTFNCGRGSDSEEILLSSTSICQTEENAKLDIIIFSVYKNQNPDVKDHWVQICCHLCCASLQDSTMRAPQFPSTGQAGEAAGSHQAGGQMKKGNARQGRSQSPIRSAFTRTSARVQNLEKTSTPSTAGWEAQALLAVRAAVTASQHFTHRRACLHLQTLGSEETALLSLLMF